MPRLLGAPASPTGALLAALMLVGSLRPSLLPRATSGQVLVSALAAITGYAIGATAGALVRAVVRDRWPVPALRRQLGAVAWALAGVVAVLAVVVSPRRMGWIGDQAAAIGASGGAPSWPIALLGAVVLAYVVLVLGRAVRAGGRGLAKVAARWIRRPSAASLVGGAVMAVLLAAGVAAAYAGMLAVFSRIDASTDGQQAPASADRSGGPGSLVPWTTLGREGRTFVGGGPTPAQLAAFAGTATAPEPIRVFAGLDSAPTPEARAALAVDELRRTDAFSRKAIVVITTTGNGFVDPVAADSVEYVLGGDVASAAIQYSVLPSWLSFLVDQQGSEQAGVALLRAVREAVAALPADQRPKVYAYGESLGAYGSLAAFPGSPDDAASAVDGGLWVGPPSSSSTWARWYAQADGGTAWQPQVGGGATLRYAADSAAVTAAAHAAAWGPHRLLMVAHATDPVVWFDAPLAWARPGWLDDPRGPGVPSQVRWWPVLLLDQVAMDLAPAGSAPQGAGHNYGAEVPGAWAAVIAPEGWTDADTARLTAAVG